MKYLFLLFFLHFYFCSFSQININKTETETVPPPPPSRIPKQNYGDTIEVIFEDERYKIPPAPPPPPRPQPRNPKQMDGDEKVNQVNDVYPPPPDIPPPPPPPSIESKKPIKPAAAPIIEFPDVSAGFPGGSSVMMKWINDNLVYPQISIENNHQGRVFVSFVIEKDGSITNVKVERGISVDLDKEAQRIVRKMPKWIPGESAGIVVRSRIRLPINFTLN